MPASRLFVSLFLAARCFAPAHAADAPSAADHAADRVAIERVVQQFQDAIKAHDGKALESLFLQDHNSWLSVLDTPTWVEMQKRSPDAKKYRESGWREFAAMVAKDKKPLEERFYNVRIETNGALASVYFDFDFVSDGQVTNRGAESWQMLRAEDGWKISSMLFSIGR